MCKIKRKSYKKKPQIYFIYCKNGVLKILEFMSEKDFFYNSPKEETSSIFILCGNKKQEINVNMGKNVIFHKQVTDSNLVRFEIGQSIYDNGFTVDVKY